VGLNIAVVNRRARRGRGRRGLRSAPWLALTAGLALGLALPDGAYAASVEELATPTPNAQPIGLTVGSTSALWFTESGVGVQKIARITTSGAITEQAASTTNAPLYIAQGIDGNAWFTEASRPSLIGSMSTDGTLAEFGQSSGATTLAGSDPQGIVSGTDGNLWFTETGSNQIAAVSVTGMVAQEWSTVGSRPSAIALGPDGNLWFTEPGSNSIGTSSTAAPPTLDYPIPTPDAGPEAITSGPDGALWFTESTKDKIGRITTAGAVSDEFPLAAGSSPNGIVLGPDGALWITERGTDKVARMTTTGTVTEYPATPGAGLGQIIVGPDNALWFIEQNGSRIGRLLPDATTSPGGAGSTATPTATPRPEDAVASQTFAALEEGTVLIELPGTHRFVRLTSTSAIPPGAVVDTTRGRVRLCSPREDRSRQCASFYQGRFRVGRPTRDHTLPLALVGGSFHRTCSRARDRGRRRHRRGPTRLPAFAGAAAVHSARPPSSPTVRKMWGSGRGRFSTGGRYAAATVRGTIWLVEDRCDGTKVTVKRGVVSVLDRRRHRTITVHAGHAYLARRRGR
jgi:streptogramin lyase